MEELKQATFEGKEVNKIPEGATILKKDFSLTVEEIENGYIIRKSYDIKYQMGDNTEYSYYTKKWFSKDNPMTIDMKATEEKTLAEKFE